jgi:hypothetical protein
MGDPPAIVRAAELIVDPCEGQLRRAAAPDDVIFALLGARDE